MIGHSLPRYLYNNFKILVYIVWGKNPDIFDEPFSFGTLKFNEIHDSWFCRNNDLYKFFNMLKEFNPVMD